MTSKEIRDIEQVEKNINNFKSYKDIPPQFINRVEDRFSMYGYLKSLLELKKEQG